MNQEYSTMKCRCCQSRMKIDGYSEVYNSDEKRVNISCRNPQCVLNEYTFVESTYADYDLSKYLKGIK